MNTIDEFRGKYHFLSNFAVHQVKYDGAAWKTSEHAYQAAKTHDKDEKTRVQLCQTPGLSKKAGKRVTLRDDWGEVKIRIMEEIVRSKFTNNRVLARKLLATEDDRLVEGNSWHDNWWGNCTCGSPSCDYPGYNNLGLILMKIRSELSDAEGDG